MEGNFTNLFDNFNVVEDFTNTDDEKEHEKH